MARTTPVPLDANSLRLGAAVRKSLTGKPGLFQSCSQPETSGFPAVKSTAVLSAERSFVATLFNVRFADFPAVRLAPLYGRYLRIAVVGRAPHFASAARSQTLVNGPLRSLVGDLDCCGAARRTCHSPRLQIRSGDGLVVCGQNRHEWEFFAHCSSMQVFLNDRFAVRRKNDHTQQTVCRARS